MKPNRTPLSLKSMNSFGVEAVAAGCVEFADVESLRAFFAEQRSSGESWYVLSGGNNVLFTRDYPGVILHPVAQGITLLDEKDGKAMVKVGAGVEWDDFVAWAVDHGYGGIENLSLIPGYVGAAPVQNIGAYGAEAKDTIREVEFYSPEKDQIEVLSAEACAFGYRDSIFKRELRGRAIILSVTFALDLVPVFRLGYGDLKAKVEEAGGLTLHTVRDAVVAIRRSKLPDPKELGNAGSFFKNPVVSREVAEHLKTQYPDMPSYEVGEDRVKLAAGWLIDRAGWKGRRVGHVGVHEHQALVLVNYGGGTGNEVLELAHRIQQEVADRFGVEIDMEVNVL